MVLSYSRDPFCRNCALGQLVDQVEKNAAPDPDVTVSALHHVYNAFGRMTERKHTTTAGVVKETDYTVDSIGRVTTSEELAAGVLHSFTYPVNQATGTQETIAYDDGATPATAVTVTTNARGGRGRQGRDPGHKKRRQELETPDVRGAG